MAKLREVLAKPNGELLGLDWVVYGDIDKLELIKTARRYGWTYYRQDIGTKTWMLYFDPTPKRVKRSLRGLGVQ
jgi:hypothetical protein